MTTHQVPPRATQPCSVPYEHPDVGRLVEDLQAVYISIYGQPDGSPVEPGGFTAPNGACHLGERLTA